MDTLLVIGASGLLGQHLVNQGRNVFQKVIGTYYDNPFTAEGVDTQRLDILSVESVNDLLGTEKPDFAILTSGLTGVDYCEEHPEEAEALNETGPLNVARACAETDTRLIHVSTDYVFDGDRGGYTEEDETNPVSVYGQTKLDGESAVLQAHPESVIARVCVLYGWNVLTSKSNFVTWVLGTLEDGKEVELFSDQIVTPTYAHEAAGILLRLLRTDNRGLFHASGRERVSRYEMGVRIADTFGLDKEKLIPRSMDEVGLKARRPRNSSLVVEKIEKTLNTKMQSISLSLEHMRDTR